MSNSASKTSPTSTPASTTNNSTSITSGTTSLTTSTSSAFPSGATATDSSSSSNGQPQDSLQSSASLYLYTFLATLVLLLGVSAAIVIRSLLLRRRHRRMIEEAIRNGTWIPPANNRIRIDPSKKPKLFEAYLAAPPDSPTNGKLKSATLDEHQEWDGIMPFSVAYATPPQSVPTAETPSRSSTDLSTNPLTTFIPTQIRSRWRRTFGQSTTSVPSTPVPMTSVSTPHVSVPGTPTASASSSPPSSLRVAVLIAMPSPTPLGDILQKNQHQHVEEDDLPHIEFGVAEIPVHEHSSTEEKDREGGKRSIGSDEM